MNFKLNVTTSKAIVATAAIATAIMAMQSPAEARRYKQKVVRHHHVAVTPAPVFGGILGAGNQYMHLTRGSAASPRHQAARGTRQARTVTPRVSRAARALHASVAPMAGFGTSSLVAKARSYVGTNPTGMGALWCARFMNMVLEKSGRRGTGSNMAKSFAGYGRRVSGPQVGAIAVMSRGRGGGHVGIVSGVDKSGNPIIISGNHNRRVGEAVYPRGRIYAYVMP
jgi:uncharacterized protein (TIGR02594 family)